MNNVQLSGRLTKNPDVRQHQKKDGTTFLVATYTLAVDRPKRGGEKKDADFFLCKCFNKTAEFAQKYLVKGTKVIVNGSLQSSSFQGKSGETVWRTEVIVARHEFAESKGENEQRRAAAGMGQPTTYGNYNYGGQQVVPSNYQNAGTPVQPGYNTTSGTTNYQNAPGTAYPPAYPPQYSQGSLPIGTMVAQPMQGAPQTPINNPGLPEGFVPLGDTVVDDLPWS